MGLFTNQLIDEQYHELTCFVGFQPVTGNSGYTATTKGFEMSRPMGKPTICIGENKGADQLRGNRGNREADQRLCFRYSDSTIPPLLNSKISSF